MHRNVWCYPRHGLSFQTSLAYPIGGMIIPRGFTISCQWKQNSTAREAMAQTQRDRDDSGMTANRWRGASLTAASAVLSVCLYAVVAAPAVNEDVGIGPPPALAPGQAPPLPKAGPLAQPRSQDQIGFPSALTASVIPPASPLTPAMVALGEKLFFESRLSGDGTVACATCHDPARALRTAGPRQSASTAASVSATRQPF